MWTHPIHRSINHCQELRSRIFRLKFSKELQNSETLLKFVVPSLEHELAALERDIVEAVQLLCSKDAREAEYNLEETIRLADKYGIPYKSSKQPNEEKQNG